MVASHIRKLVNVMQSNVSLLVIFLKLLILLFVL